MSKSADTRDYSETLFLPRTDFPMRAGLPRREPEILARWERLDIHRRQREAAAGRETYVLHDGPPYANGHLHIGTGLNKILKDMVARSRQMLGFDSNYVPGWDCHGLPIEWKIEEQYRAKGLDKDAVPVVEFRRECRQFAEYWIDVQREEFKRLGVAGDWATPYTTMSFAAEARIARELMKFAMSGALYRGSKPVMWSVVERTALAEAEVEYHEVESDQIWVKFPIMYPGPVAEWGSGKAEELISKLRTASLIIWTTTPWTIPGNRAISYSSRISYGLYLVRNAPDGNWLQTGERVIIADSLSDEVLNKARAADWIREASVSNPFLQGSNMCCAHPFNAAFSSGLSGYDFRVPLLEGSHVTDETGTGFVHTAPGHGGEDFEVWMDNKAALEARSIDTTIPYTVDADGAFTADAPGFTAKRVITDDGAPGDANPAVIEALKEAGMLIARGRLKHQYPHSWRSKKPVIFRNTPQWFISMEDHKGADGLRAKALKAIDETRFVPDSGRARLRGMVESRPDWVVSRQRAWGVPITVFRNTDDGTLLPGDHPDWRGESEELERRIFEAFAAEGADAWFATDAKDRFLSGIVTDPANWEMVGDILDVWFDSGSTHAFVLEARDDLKWPASLYLEGSDQHRGWFQSSLLESAGTRGRAPYDAVLTHGFVMAEDGRKMSKSLDNVVAPQDVIENNGAEILRVWVASSDYSEDLRIGPEIVKANVETYRKLRNTLRWMLGSLAHFREGERVDVADMPELERYMLHRLAELDETVRRGYADYDFKRVFQALFTFATVDLSAFYFDVRKDALYCDPASSTRRKASLTVLDHLFSCLTAWLAPLLPFTMEEVWQSRFPSDDDSVHLRLFPEIPAGWRDDALGGKWRKVRRVRRVVTGALEIERAAKRIGASLEAAPEVYVSDPDLLEAIRDIDLAEVSITSAATPIEGEGPDDAYRFDDVPGVAVVARRAEGRKCARSWRVLPEVGSDPDYPDLSLRDAAAMREYEAAGAAAE